MISLIEQDYQVQNWRDSMIAAGPRSLQSAQGGVPKLSTFGVSFLDEALRIEPTSFILVGASTGTGKTQLAYTLARQNAEYGRKVFGVFLEAYAGEMQERRRFQMFLEEYFADKEKSGEALDLRFVIWKTGALNQAFEKYEPAITKRLQGEPSKLEVVTKLKKFDVESLVELKDEALSKGAELLVIDHIHYFDYNQEQETKALTEIISVLDKTSSNDKLPVVLFAQFRKEAYGKNKNFKDIHDFHGSANLTRVPTDVIVLTRGEYDASLKVTSTYFDIQKTRHAQCDHLVGKLNFSVKKQWYLEPYQLGRIQKDEFEVVDEAQVPVWAKKARRF